jgi:Mn-containing catalase
MLGLLREFYRDKAAMRQSHVSAARFVSDYNFNNTYQYIIAREDMHVRWLADAVTDLAGALEEPALGEMHSPVKARDVQRSVIEVSSRESQEFLDRWRPRINALPNARHRTMLNVILGETLEHKRFFDLALAGREDLLGRRADGMGTGGGVMGSRWVGDITK